MKAPPFKYCRPDTLPEALELLRHHGDDARLLAGGQSLLPALNMRLSSPAVLIDLGRIAELRGIVESAEGLRIGAMTRHVEVERSSLVARYAPLLSQAMPLVAHPPIRAMGTYGGSVALADPAAEAPAATLAHGATLVARSLAGERHIPADDFYTGMYSTALAPDAILVAGHFSPPVPGERFLMRELARRSGDFATVGVALRASVVARRVTRLRLVVFGVGDRPTLVQSAASAAAGREFGPAWRETVVEAVLSEVTPWADTHHSEGTKRQLLAVLLRRTLAELEGPLDA